jgi:predicted Rossmann fold nucleotide-binding protein DprA/Smf involved in DNA uptake
MQTLGNIELLKLPKTAFLCSRRVPASVVLKCYDWATAMREAGLCVVSGFHSPLERDVLHFLLKGRQPVILVLGRAMYKQLPKELVKPLAEKRLLIISVSSAPRQSEQTADVRNRYIADIADRMVFGYLNPEGKLAELYRQIAGKGKETMVL